MSCGGRGESPVQIASRILEDLHNAGAASIFNKPRFQDPPRFPEGYPDRLDHLDGLASWGLYLCGEPAGQGRSTPEPE